MNILITGGLGYIGGRIADYFKNKKPGIGIFLTTRDKGKELPQWTGDFSVLQMDIVDEESISRCLDDSKPDIIIHLAALNQIDSMRNPELALKINTKGTQKLLKYAYQKQVERFIYFSTFHVYGKNIRPVITEHTSTNPSHPYAVTHLAAEEAVALYRDKGMNTLVFRLSNSYGYPMDKSINQWELVVNDLCRQAVVTNKIILRSSGRQHRDFIALGDVARAVYRFIFVAPDKWADGLYNLGAGQSMSILEVARKISDIYEKRYNGGAIKIQIESEDNNLNAKPFVYCVDKIKNTGFRLEGNMEVEIAKTMSVCEEFLKERV